MPHDVKQIGVVRHGVQAGQKTRRQNADAAHDIDLTRQAGEQNKDDHHHGDAGYQNIRQGDALKQFDLNFCFAGYQSHGEPSPP